MIAGSMERRDTLYKDERWETGEVKVEGSGRSVVLWIPDPTKTLGEISWREENTEF